MTQQSLDTLPTTYDQYCTLCNRRGLDPAVTSEQFRLVLESKRRDQSAQQVRGDYPVDAQIPAGELSDARFEVIRAGLLLEESLRPGSTGLNGGNGFSASALVNYLRTQKPNARDVIAGFPWLGKLMDGEFHGGKRIFGDAVGWELSNNGVVTAVLWGMPTGTYQFCSKQSEHITGLTAPESYCMQIHIPNKPQQRFAHINDTMSIEANSEYSLIISGPVVCLCSFEEIKFERL